MNLNFSIRWPKEMPPHMAGKPTCFVDKITQCMWKHHSKEMMQYALNSELREEIYTYSTPAEIEKIKPKLHSFRTDEKDRWKAGNDIHFFINARTKDMFQFAPVVKCVSTQKIEIKHNNPLQRDERWNKSHVWIDGENNECLWKNGVIMNCSYTIEQLAINDGFDSIEDFFSWFNKDFVGKIIHWTPLRY